MYTKSKIVLMILPLIMCLSACVGSGVSSQTPSQTPSSVAPTSSSEVKPSSQPVSSKASSQPSSSTWVPQGDIPEPGTLSVKFHYYRSDKKYDKWGVWMWGSIAPEKTFTFNMKDDDWAVAYYALDTFGEDTEEAGLGFIVRLQSDWTKDIDKDRWINFAALEKDSDNAYNVYVYSGDETIYISKDKKTPDTINYVKFNNDTTVAFSANKKISKFKIFENGNLLKETNPDSQTGEIKLDNAADISNLYLASLTFKDDGIEYAKDIYIGALYDATSFDSSYYYDGELGAIYNATKTTFKVWSPVSSNITLKVYSNGTPASLGGSDVVETTLEMTKGEKGVFSAEIDGDLQGKYYTYTVVNASYPLGKEIVDPYAKSTGFNGLRGMIVDFSKTNPDAWDSVTVNAYDRKELTVYETHVADVTSSSTWTGTEANRYRYLGLVESGTTYTEGETTVKTGFDHIKELGINAVQFVPIFDQDNNEVIVPTGDNHSFNWGYNPLNYNSLEGIYSSNPHDGYAKIREFKQVVKEFTNSGINIIMDVVYNHTSGAVGNNFDVLMPYYYYRYSGTGVISNGSGCGNETASNRSMYRKFMIDSTEFWAKEYKLGGFRFDLMGLHDLTTMETLTSNLKENVNENIVVYGEPWEGGTSALPAKQQADQANGRLWVGYGGFNDQQRDALIKGGLNDVTTKGWAMSTSTIGVCTHIVNGMQGKTNANISDPNKTVNYATCHDNYTLYDRMFKAGITNVSDVRKMCVLANAVTFTSQGTTFMLAGEEFLRTKNGSGNSYNLDYKTNELNYALKIKNMDIFNNYKALINIKQSLDCLHYEAEEIEANETVVYDSSYSMITATINTQDREIKIIHCNGNLGTGVKVDLTGYSVLHDTLGLYVAVSGEILLHPYQSLILSKTK